MRNYLKIFIHIVILLSAMDITSFLERTGKSKADVARSLGKDPKSSLISAYENGNSNPSFEVVVKLIKLGMTPLEIFGEEIDQIFRRHYSQDFGKLDTPEFSEGFGASFDSKVESVVLKMKAEGRI